MADPSEIRAGGAIIEARFDDSKVPEQMRAAFARMAALARKLSELIGKPIVTGSVLGGLGKAMAAGASAAMSATTAVFRGGFRVINVLARGMVSGIVGAFSGMNALVQAFAAKTVAAINAASAALRRNGDLFQRLGVNLLIFGTASGAALVAVARGFSSMSEELLRASQRIGFSVQSLQSLRFAANQLHIDTAGLEIAIRRMQGYLLSLGEGASTNAREFAVLGLNFHQVAQMSPEDQFLTIVGALRQVKDQTLQLALAQKIFGGTSATLGTNIGRIITPLLTSGQGLDQLRERFKELNLTLSAGDIAAGTRLAQAFREIFAQLEVLRYKIGSVITSGLSPYIDNIQRILAATIDWVKEHRGLVTTLAASTAAFAAFSSAVGGGFLVFGRGLTTLALGVRVLALVVTPALSLVATAFGLIANPVSFAIASIALLGLSIVRFTKIGSSAAQTVGNSFRALGTRLAGTVGSVVGKALHWFAGKLRELGPIASEAFAGIADALASGDLKAAAEIAWAAIQTVFAKGVAAINTIMAGIGLAWENMVHAMTVAWIKFDALVQKSAAARALFFGLAHPAAATDLALLTKMQEEIGKWQGIAQQEAAKGNAENVKSARKVIADLIFNPTGNPEQNINGTSLAKALGLTPLEITDLVGAGIEHPGRTGLAALQGRADKFARNELNVPLEAPDADAALAAEKEIHDQRIKDINSELATSLKAAKTLEDAARARLKALRETAAENRRASEAADARRAREFEKNLPKEEGENHATLESFIKAAPRIQIGGQNAEFTLGGAHGDALSKTADYTRRTAEATEKLAGEAQSGPTAPPPAPPAITGPSILAAIAGAGREAPPAPPLETAPSAPPPVPPALPDLALATPGSPFVGNENPAAISPAEARNQRLRARGLLTESADARARIRQREEADRAHRNARFGNQTRFNRNYASNALAGAPRAIGALGGIPAALGGILASAISKATIPQVRIPHTLAGTGAHRFVPPMYANDYLRTIAENSAKQTRYQSDLNRKATPLVATP